MANLTHLPDSVSHRLMALVVAGAPLLLTVSCGPQHVPVQCPEPIECVTESEVAVTPNEQAQETPSLLAEHGASMGIEESHVATVSAIIEAAMGARSGRGYDLLVELCDDYGARPIGSDELARAIDWAANRLRAAGHENVALEPVTAKHWVRGNESLTMLSPRQLDLPILGLGRSVGTPPEGIEADLVVLGGEDELAGLASGALEGKIVLWDVAMPDFDHETRETGYGDTVKYRFAGANMASERGAVASLVRSVTANSLGAPHTGTMSYGETPSESHIPAAAVTVEDAELLHRLYSRSRSVRLRLEMDATVRGEIASANVIGELVGREKPDEIVVIGGHIDSWDVGQGAHDNGSGVVIAMEALTLLRELELRPKRTIRVVLWTNEENGLDGAKAYAEQHAAELAKHVAAIESDSGGDRVESLRMAWPDDEIEAEALARLGAAAELLSADERVGRVDASEGSSGADTWPLREQGVLGIGLRHDMHRYFDFHHSAADTIDKIDPVAIDQGVATMAALAWLLAEIDGTVVPR